jgi:DNA-binding CsgD family transcriptional regulator
VAVINESHLLEGAGRHERAAEVARNGLAEAQRYGLSRTSGSILAINLAEPLASLGRWDEAAEVITAALAISSVDPNRASLWQLAGTMAVARGDLARAREAAEQGTRLLARLTYRDQTFMPLARLQIESATADGRLGDALAAASRALDSYDLQATPRYAWPVLIAAVRAAAELAALPAAARAEGDAEAAGAVLRGARAAAGKLDVLSPVQAADQLTFQAESARADYAGTILPAADADADAEPAADAGDPGPWLAAAAAWDELRQPYPVAAALLRAAEAALSGRGDRAVAEQALRRAAGIAGGLGAAPLLADVTLLARRARISLDGPAAGEAPAVAARASPPGPGVSAAGRLGLTPREFEVLRLVAAGLSNAAIAGQLFISAKTVSVHVSNILAKLGTATRGEASALAHRLRLFDHYPAA